MARRFARTLRMLRNAVSASLAPFGNDRRRLASLARASLKLGRPEEALVHFEQLRRVAPRDVKTLLTMAKIEERRGNARRAIGLLGEALLVAPSRVDLHVRLGKLQARETVPGAGPSRGAEAAVAHFRQAVTLQPGERDHHVALGTALIALADLQYMASHMDAADASLREGIASFRHALAIPPPPDAKAAATISAALGDALRCDGKDDEALIWLRRAVDAEPTERALTKLADVVADLGRPDESLASYDLALALRPDADGALRGKALSLRRMGRLAEAAEVDRSRGPAEVPLPPDTPRWDGSDLSGRRILLAGSKGIGDEIRVMSCYGDILRASAECHIACEPRLEELVRRSFPGATVHGVARRFARHAPLPERVALPEGFWASLPRFDYYSTTADVPHHVRRSFDAFRRPTPHYLLADPDRQALWRERLRPLGTGLRVGLSWSTAYPTLEGHRDYTRLPDWRRLLERSDVHFVNIQHAAEAQIRELEAQVPVVLHRWPDLDLRNDFENMAALITQLDVVMGAPTTVVELAAALGVETWRIVASRDRANVWRVFPGTKQDLWHPRMIQIDGEPAGDVRDLMTRVGAALDARVDARPGATPAA
jgi:tetratricopeptide (TPR) repeat protein